MPIVGQNISPLEFKKQRLGFFEDARYLFFELEIGGLLMTMIFALGHISGAHFNPAGVLLSGRGKINVKETLAYIAAQFVGGILAAIVQIMVMEQWCCQDKMDMCGAGYPAVHPGVSSFTAMAVELQMTCALVLVVLNVATTKAQKNNSFFGLAIGMTVAASWWDIWWSIKSSCGYCLAIRLDDDLSG